MNLTHDAMLVSLRINSWSGRLYDRQASQQVAIHHDADTNRRALQQAAPAQAGLRRAGRDHEQCKDQSLCQHVALGRPGAAACSPSPTMSATPRRWTHWSSAWCASVPASSRTMTITSTRPASTSAACSAWRTIPAQRPFRTSSPFATVSSRSPTRRHFMADLAQGETERVRRDIEQQVRTRLNDAQRDLYRRLGEAVERVGERLREDENGKPLVFRDSLIENIRELVDVVPRLNIFADDDLAMLCREVKDKFAGIEPDALRPSGRFDPNLRRQVKRDADALTAQFAGYFAPAAENREAA